MIVNRLATPGYAEAVKAENDIRDAAFLNLPANICGIKIRQMTPRDLLILEGIGNGVLIKEFSAVDVGIFLWLMSVDYAPGAWFRRWLVANHMKHVKPSEAIRALTAYIDSTFQDSPSGKRGRGEVPFAGWCAYYIDWFGGEYGWTADQVLGTNLKVLYQLIKCIKRRHDPECILFNPSDRIKSEALRLKNEQIKLVNLLAKRGRN